MMRSKTLADQAHSVYFTGKEFLYDHVMRDQVATFPKGTDARINLRVNPQRWSLKALLSSVLSLIQPAPGIQKSTSTQP